MSFITNHLICKIEEQLREKQVLTTHNRFYWFNEPVKDGNKIINRVSRWNPFIEDEILPASWYSLKGSTLKEIFIKLKNNEFHIK